MADIFEEVEEGLRQDKMAGLWKRYGVFAYLAGALLIGGVALYEYTQFRSAEAIETHAMTLESGLKALDDQDYEAAADTFAALTEQDVDVSPVAAQFLASVRLDANGDDAAASEVLLSATYLTDDVAADPTAALSLLKSGYLIADTASQEELESLLAPLLVSDSGFGGLAKELVAAKILQSGDVAAARRAFTDLRFSDNLPSGVITRANQALAALPPIADETETDDEVAPESDDALAPAEPLDIESAPETELETAE